MTGMASLSVFYFVGVPDEIWARFIAVKGIGTNPSNFNEQLKCSANGPQRIRNRSRRPMPPNRTLCAAVAGSESENRGTA